MPDEKDIVKDNELFLPDYIQSFTAVVEKCGLTAAYCYGIIYFFGRMRGKKCTLGNDDLAFLMKVKENTVSEWLTKLEREKFIFRVKSFGRRVEIKPMFFPENHEAGQDEALREKTECTSGKNRMHFGKKPKSYNSQEENQIRKPKESSASPDGDATQGEPEEKKLTPAEEARLFFCDQSKQSVIVQWLIEQGKPESEAASLLRSFVDYWTEPTKSGKKQRWETERTFEIRRRLTTWLNNESKFNRPNKFAVTIC